jgi:hypothetical protein
MTLQPHAESCPYIAHYEDSLTLNPFPHPANYCQRAEPAGPVRSGVQLRICMTQRHLACPLLLKDWNGPLPTYLKEYQKPGWRRKVSFGLAAISGLGTAIVVLLGQQTF